MSRYRWTLLQRAQRWHVVRSDGAQTELLETPALPKDSTPAAWAEALAAVLDGGGYDGGGVLIAIDSADCLAVSAGINDADLRHERSAVIFEIERYFPLAAEEFTADYIRHKDSVFAVVVETAPLHALIEALEAKGVFIQSCVPFALAVAQFLIERLAGVEQRDRDHDYAILWDGGDYVECVFLAQKGVEAWYRLGKEPPVILQTLAAHCCKTGRPAVVRTCGIELPTAALSASHPALAFEAVAGDWGAGPQPEFPPFSQRAIAVAAEEVLSGKTVASIELLRDALATTDRYRLLRRPVQYVILGFVALMVVLSSVFLVRSRQYSRIADDYQARQTEVFRKALPNQNLTTGFRRRLESEYRQLAGLKGNTAELPRRASLLTALYRLLNSLPKNLRFRLLEIRLEQEQISLDGQVRTHGDADTIAAALRQGGFVVESPSSQQLPGGVIAVRMVIRGRDKP